MTLEKQTYIIKLKDKKRKIQEELDFIQGLIKELEDGQ
tara:strand:- start:161 stop:274 length:114 start_codon:yes stop_codon:yes gene_type:complete